MYHQLQRLAPKLRQIHNESEEPGSSHQREEPASSVGSQQREGTEEKQKKDINADDTAPQKKPVTLEYYGIDISGNETDSILRKLKTCSRMNSMVNGQVFTVKVFQHSLQVDI